MINRNTIQYRNDRSPRVLVTGAGGAAAVAVLRAYLAADITCYAADIDRHAVGLYLVPEDKRLLLPKGEDSNFAERMLELCQLYDIDVLVPTVDVELIAIGSIRKQLESGGTRVMLSPVGALRVCLDKLALAETCEGHVATPRTEAIDERFNVARWSLPFIAKPRSGSGSRGIRLIRHADELADVPRDGSYIAQAYLPGEEYSVDVFVDAGGVVRAAVPRERLKVDSGIAVASRTVRDPELEELAAEVARRVGIRFVANVQLRRDAEGRPFLLEVNPRFPGTMPLTIEANVNMPLLALHAVLGRTHWPHRFLFREVAVVRHWEEVFISPGEFDRVSEGMLAIAGAA